jgi:YegS/Rv2252/BmrU family lipid kinase
MFGPLILETSTRRLLVIYNPTAGWRRRRRFMRIVTLLERLGCHVTVKPTRARGDAEAFARDADAALFDVVVAAGGDGTINEVINGLAGRDLPLALVPLGTANVLAAEIGLDARPENIARAIAFNPARPVFSGAANGRRFAMMVGVGFDARVVEELNLPLKRLVGKLAYVASALAQIALYSRGRYQVEIDGKRHDAAALVIAKGHYYGGRFVVAKNARLDDPSLWVALFERTGRWHLLRYAAALATGRLDKLPDVKILAATSVSVYGADGEWVQGDGDLFAALPLSVTVSNHPLALVTGAA